MPARTVHLIYCILQKDDLCRSTRKPDPWPEALEEIGYRDISALARPVELEGDGHPGEEQRETWRTDYFKTNLDVFQSRTPLPVRFGTTAGSAEEVLDFLAASYLHIKALIRRVNHKAEFVVRILWDLNAVLQNIHSRQQGQKTTRSRIEVGRALFEAAERERQTISALVHRKLSALSAASSDAKRTDDSVILNRSYLVDRGQETAFDRTMAQLGRECPSYLNLKYIGPLPPYSFVPLAFTKGNFELIDSARKALDLGQFAQFGQIQTAYRRLARQYHPDRNPGDPNAGERFRQITEAYQTLRSYCQGCGQPNDEATYSFARDRVQKAFLVKERTHFI